MKINYFVFPWKKGSHGASALSAALGGRVLKTEGSRFVPSPRRRVINWGSSSCPWECLNSPKAVSVAGNKLSFFKLMAAAGETGPRVPVWTGSRDVAQVWLSETRGSTGEHRFRSVVARQSLCGHSGQGIVIVDRGGTLPEAPLYVEYVPKDAEYRVHIFNGEVIDVQRKIKDPRLEEPKDWAVRSHANGFIYTRNTSTGESHRNTVPQDVLTQSLKTMASSGLQFGAVDVVMNNKRGQAFILEVNTAPGLEGATPEIYAAAIRRYYES